MQVSDNEYQFIHGQPMIAEICSVTLPFAWPYFLYFMFCIIFLVNLRLCNKWAFIHSFTESKLFTVLLTNNNQSITGDFRCSRQDGLQFAHISSSDGPCELCFTVHRPCNLLHNKLTSEARRTEHDDVEFPWLGRLHDSTAADAGQMNWKHDNKQSIATTFPASDSGISYSWANSSLAKA